MCTGAEIALAASAVGSVGGLGMAYKARQDAKQQAARAERERKQAETEAAQRASAQVRMQKEALSKNSLFTGAGTAGGASTTLGVSGTRPPGG